MEPRMIFVTEGELVYFRSNTSASIQVQSSHYASEPVARRQRWGEEAGSLWAGGMAIGE